MTATPYRLQPGNLRLDSSFGVKRSSLGVYDVKNKQSSSSGGILPAVYFPELTIMPHKPESSSFILCTRHISGSRQYNKQGRYHYQNSGRKYAWPETEDEETSDNKSENSSDVKCEFPTRLSCVPRKHQGLRHGALASSRYKITNLKSQRKTTVTITAPIILSARTTPRKID